jgi:twitching motility protein PilJ
MLRLLRNLKIGQKLALVGFVMAIPIAILVWLYVAARDVQVEAVRQELAGLEYLLSLRDVVAGLPLHWTASEALYDGVEDAARRRSEARSMIDGAIARVDAAAARPGPRLIDESAWRQFRVDWISLAQEATQLPTEEIVARHAGLAANLNNLLLTLGERSKLLMDPEVDTHFLSRTAVEELPAWMATLASLRSLALERGGSPSADDEPMRRLLDRLTQQTADDLRGIGRGVEAAAAQNPDLEQIVIPALERTRSSAVALAERADRLAETRRRVATSQGTSDPLNVADQAFAASLELYDASLTALESGLNERYRSLQREGYLQTLLVVFVLAASTLLMLYINRIITGQISEINRLFRRISVGDLQARAQVTTHDELGSMTIALNQMLNDTLALVQSREERDRIQISIEKLLNDISGVAQGDLTKEAEVTADVTGSIADSFNYMIEQLRDVIAQVQNTTLQVSAAAAEIQHGAEKLAEGSESQSAQIVDTSAAVEEMAGSIRQVSATALSAAKVAQNALESSRRGAEAVAKAVDGMQAIRGQVQETAKRIKRLGESSQEVGEIVQLIGDIADRTSILALNASIQAAMAGEAGRGFAVVAQEVESLAERATESTKRIAGLISSIQQDMNQAVRAMEDTTKEVVGGSTLANEAGETLERIETVSGELEQLIRSISEASTLQAAGSDTVARTMGEISQGALQTADGARQAAGDIRSLAALADELRKSVSRFKVPARTVRA